MLDAMTHLIEKVKKDEKLSTKIFSWARLIPFLLHVLQIASTLLTLYAFNRFLISDNSSGPTLYKYEWLL